MAILGGRVRNVLILACDADGGALPGEGCDDDHADYSGSTWLCPVFLLAFLRVPFDLCFGLDECIDRFRTKGGRKEVSGYQLALRLGGQGCQMEPPTRIWASICSFFKFLPFFVGLLLLGIIKGALLFPWAWLIMMIGISALILGLWPMLVIGHITASSGSV
ncbi:hypothetical protein GUJ93_ZPchr0001g30853 [Zizania palustris]|uniref:Uncharacterized protein n=1 Tax=Zizania palustris TaxID=103762 RepID=A0A8J5S030_ZIZPA|nr:hypothetical protein GUJ93_ZPchr0001g30853 [Zizania palustris]